MNKTDSLAIQLLAYAYLQHGAAEKSVSLLVALDAVAPGDQKTLKALAVAQTRSGRHQDALNTLERVALSLNGQPDALAKLLTARGLAGLGRLDEAAHFASLYLSAGHVDLTTGGAA